MKIESSGPQNPIVDVEEAIIKARALLDEQENADRELRHIDQALHRSAVAARVEDMHDAARENFYAGMATSIGEGAQAAVTYGLNKGSLDGTESTLATQVINGGIRATSGAANAFLERSAADSAAAGVAGEAIASEFSAAAEDRAQERMAANRSRERITDAFAEVLRARAEARLAASRG